MKKNIYSSSERLPGLKPDIIGMVVPMNALEQKDVFLRGEVYNPKQVYNKLNRDLAADFAEIVNVGENAINELGADSKHACIYEEYIEAFAESLDYAAMLTRYNNETDEKKKAELREALIVLDREQYGEPTREEYVHILADMLSVIDSRPLHGQAGQLYHELLDAVAARRCA